ncbi:MAG TPA: HNH endonuclease, partial [Burkholderiaceae bacterium]|nr:HNH endonuclease [Burkholderiaceae bacterium]
MNRAARYYAAGKVLTELGASSFELVGGTQETTGQRSMLATNSIVMIRGHLRAQRGHVCLTKHRLFLRDRHLCAYCGRLFSDNELTIEHIPPLSQGGRHHWTNVVTACRACNGRKGGRTPEQAHMPLLYVPYAVSRC